MAQTISQIRVSLRLPWWWRLYLYTLKFCDDCGVLVVAPDVAAAIIARNIQVECLITVSEVNVKTIRYFERAPIGHHVHPNDLDLDQD